MIMIIDSWNNTSTLKIPVISITFNNIVIIGAKWVMERER